MPRSGLHAILLVATLATFLGARRVDAAWAPGGSPVAWDCTGWVEELSALADGAGGAFFVWNSLAGDRVRRVDASGDLHPGWTVCGALLSNEPTGTFYQYEHVECPDGSGGLFVFFRMIVGCVASCAGDPRALYLQRVTADGGLAPGWPAAGIAIASTAAGIDHFDPALTPDGSGGVVLAWMERPWFTTGGDIRAQRVAGDGTVLWSAGGVAVCAADGAQLHPAIVATPAGGALVFWDDARAGTTVSDLYARALAPDGTPAAPADGVPLCTAPGAQTLPAALADGAGGAFVVWRDARSGVDRKYFAQRVTGALAPLWAANGIAVSGSSYDFFPPAPVSDGDGGFLLVWSDARNAASTAADVYAQRIGPAGTPAAGWTAGGIPLATAPGDQLYAQIAPDGLGGFFGAWSDTRSGDMDLFGGRWHGDGTRASGWPENGAALCAVSGAQRPVGLVTSTPGSAIVVWLDARQAPRDLAYATRMVDDGPVPVEASLVVARATASRVELVGQLADGCAAAASVERTAGEGWSPQATLAPDGTCRVVWSDVAVEPGRRYGYRLAWIDRSGEHRSAETWVEVPRAERLAIRGVRPIASGSALEVEWTAAPEGEVTLALLDVAGRRCAISRFAPPGGGITTSTLRVPAVMASGVYIVVAEQAGRRATKSVAVIR